jgi:large subunit ribosomal protein L20
MPRSTNSVKAKSRKKRILKSAKGFFGARKNVWSVAKNAVEKSMQYAYRDRRVKKREFRKLWIQRINAAVKEYGMSYSKFIFVVNNLNIKLNRKILSDLAVNNNSIFFLIVKYVMNNR